MFGCCRLSPERPPPVLERCAYAATERCVIIRTSAVVQFHVRCWSAVVHSHVDTAAQGFRVWKLCTFSLNFAFCVHPCVPLWGPVCLSMRACLYVSSDTCCPRRWQRRHQRRLHVFCPHMLACFRVSFAVEIVDDCACLSDCVRAIRTMCGPVCVSVCMLYAALCILHAVDVVRDVMKDISTSFARRPPVCCFEVRHPCHRTMGFSIVSVLLSGGSCCSTEWYTV